MPPVPLADAPARRPPAAVRPEPRPSPRALSVLVFGAGTGTLATEISASRLLAPFFGSSTVVWANLIGLVLASLALGYWLGGRLADRRPSARLLGAIVLAAAVMVAAVPFLSRPLLDATARGLDELSAGAVLGSFFGTLLLFAPPVVALGIVSPFAIRLAIDDVGSAGAVAGRLYALSTAGSLLGTFLPALVTIPLVGTQRTLIGSAVVLAASATVLLGRRALPLVVAVAALLAIPPGTVKATDGVLYEHESPYQYIQVVERDGVRRLYLNEGIAVHSLWRRDTVLTGGIWDAFLAVPLLLERPPERLAVLGNAGGTVARAFGTYYPQVEIDGVEIDPAVSDAGRRYLGLGDNSRLTVHDADARPFLRRTDERYDLVYVDAYHQPYVPFYLATREFFALVRERLRPGGLVALNVATVPEDRRLVRGLTSTLAREFPHVRVWPVLRFNHVVVGLTRPPPAGPRVAPSRELEPLVRLLARDLRPAGPLEDAWTDDRAPVEWITDRMILEYAARGGELDETPLPTAPP
jgi:spermidine synthase